MSRCPKGCVPRTYWRGTPLLRSSHSRRSLTPGEVAERVDRICSLIHRSSVKADGMSLQTGSNVAAYGEILRALLVSEGGTLGIASWADVCAEV